MMSDRQIKNIMITIILNSNVEIMESRKLVFDFLAGFLVVRRIGNIRNIEIVFFFFTVSQLTRHY